MRNIDYQIALGGGLILLFGVEDGSFKAFPKRVLMYTVMCGVLTEFDMIKDVKLTEIEVDGFDATEKLLHMLEGIEADALILGGITFAGFNIVNPVQIFSEKEIPVIVYSGVRPNNRKMLEALKKHFNDWERRWNIIENLGNVYRIRSHPREPPVYFEVIGCSESWAGNVLKESAVLCRVPEPVRVARLIARGLSRTF